MSIDRILFSGKGTLPILEQAISFTEKRQAVLAQNLANVDTYGYKAKDLDVNSFQKMMRNAIDEREKEHPRQFILREEQNINVNTSTGDISFEILEPSDDSSLRHDQNNVTYESELSKVVQNGMAYRAYTKLLKDHFDMLNKAILGR